MALKDLQHYLDHPDDIPTDPAELAELEKLMNGAPEPATDPELAVKEPSAPAGADEPKKDEPAKVDEKQAGEKKEGEEEAPIATRDGKRTIPYDVLRSERERRQVAESAVQELTSKVAEIQEQLAKGTQAGDAKASEVAKEAAGTLDPEELEALRSDFPVFGKVLDKLMSTIDGLTTQVTTLQEREQSRQIETQRTVAMTVQDHIDANPVLSHLQSTNPDLFARAVEIDNTLRKDPKFGDMGDRFAKVAATMETLYGPFDGVVKEKVTEEVPPTPPVSKEAARKAVEEKIKGSPASPKSLSDLPAGEAPESNEFDAINNASASEIGDKLLRMTPEQRTAFLNRI